MFWIVCLCVCEFVCLCSRLCGYHSPLHLLISWCVVVIHSKGDLFATSSDWMHSIVTYWQVKYKKRVKAFCLKLSCGAKRRLHLICAGDELFWGSEGWEGGREVLPVTRVYFWAWAAEVLCTRHLPVKVQSPFQWLQFGMGCAQHLDVCRNSTDFGGEI